MFATPATNYYATDIGGVRVYTLNTESAIGGNQTTWLQQDLNAHSDAPWTFVQFHRPIRPHTSGKPEGTEQYRNWAQLFYDQGVDLVIDSDSHLIKSTWPIRPSTGSGSDEGFARDDVNGTVYIGEGGWGAPLRRADDLKTWTRDAASFNHFHWIFVERDRVQVRAINTSNAAEVGSVSEADPFTPPTGLQVWNPANGPVLEIARSRAAGPEAVSQRE